MNRKLLFFCVLALPAAACQAQAVTVRSDVYEWNDLAVEKGQFRERRQVLEGSTTDLESLEIYTITLAPGMAPHPLHVDKEEEALVIVREGKLKVTIKDKTGILGPGSVALALPGDEHGFDNGGDVPVTYYVFKYRSRLPVNSARGEEAGGSFMLDREEIVFTAHGKGGVRKYFEKPTAMLGRLEMHVTTLNAGLKSHEPHTHRPAEIILLMKGNAEMQINADFKAASPGALIFLASQVPHAIRNTGDGPCEYFAIQWQ